MDNLSQNIQELGHGKTDEENNDEANGQVELNKRILGRADDFGDGDGSMGNHSCSVCDNSGVAFIMWSHVETH